MKTALRIAEFDLARRKAELLRASAPADPEVLALYADSLWSGGLFDEADEVYRAGAGDQQGIVARAVRDRALAGHAHASSRKRSPRRRRPLAMAPRDGEIHAEIGEIYERLNRFDEAANAYNNFINLLPNKDRSDKAAWTRSQVKFLKAFEGRDARRYRSARTSRRCTRCRSGSSTTRSSSRRR